MAEVVEGGGEGRLRFVLVVPWAWGLSGGWEKWWSSASLSELDE